MSRLSHPIVPQALFLDRDGTVIEDRHYLCDPDGVALLPGVGEESRTGLKLFGFLFALNHPAVLTLPAEG